MRSLTGTSCRRHSLAAATFVLVSAPTAASATDWYVRAGAAGGGDGTRAKPFATIRPAVAAAAVGDRVLVAEGDYAESVSISEGPSELRGGYASDFASNDPRAHVTRIRASGPVGVTFTNAGTTTLSGFVVTGASLHGVQTTGGVPTIEDNVLERNGSTAAGDRGGGLYTSGGEPHVVRNVVRNNTSGRGAGIAILGGRDYVVDGNVVEDNVAHGDHGGGLYLNGVGRASNNLVRRNEIGRTLDYGFGGGFYVFNPNSRATLSHNVVTQNWAASAGGGEFVDEAATAFLDHELIYDNEVSQRGGAGIYVDGLGEPDGGSKATLDHCTVAHNKGGTSTGGNGIRIATESQVTVTNSIFWGNGDDFLVGDPLVRLDMRHSISKEVVSGTGNLQVDPLFADPDAGDFHVRSIAGRWDPRSGDGGAWVHDTVSSPAIDSADPAAPFAAERAPNGGRANLGVYGDTDQASLSGDAAVDALPPAPSDAGVRDATVGPGPDSGGNSSARPDGASPTPSDASSDGSVDGSGADTDAPSTGGGCRAVPAADGDGNHAAWIALGVFAVAVGVRARSRRATVRSASR
ncbi:MAG: right-handed parallel beta-helix repeat-containing protein [Polyangiaceae bacterium]